MGRRLATALGLCACLAALAGCGSGGDSAATEATPKRATLKDVSNVLELRAAFNEDRGKPRLLLILSPT